MANEEKEKRPSPQDEQAESNPPSNEEAGVAPAAAEPNKLITEEPEPQLEAEAGPEQPASEEPEPQPETKAEARPAPRLRGTMRTLSTGGFPIVGIGASAGGLQALEEFFSHAPSETESGMAFVLVQHLDPSHESILAELVRRYTKMEVKQVTDGVEVKPNSIYIIPPNKDMALLRGKLHLTEPAAARGMRLPIDFFFRSLAQDQHERAIGIILSGTGYDGTLGIKAIKEEGGMVMAQDPNTAKYDGMPLSAINTGLMDYILPPAEMPAQLSDYVKRIFGGGALAPKEAPQAAQGALQRIFVLLRARTGHDFSLYKNNTVMRRIERRMALNQIENIDGYVHFLQRNPQEIEALFHELLIGVTQFFRDREAWEALASMTLPALLASKPLNEVVRVWVPGCSTGEEAYTIAMLLQEQVGDPTREHKVQVFATDIDARAIDKARAGVYPESIVADVSQERLARFFTHEEGAYQVRKSLRDLVVFAEQDVAVDPPFSRLDLISCRNLLIYMGPEMQSTVLKLFHYALNPNGVLFLGTSESIGEFANLYAVVDRKLKIYRRRGAPTSNAAMAQLPSYYPASHRGAAPLPMETKGGQGTLQAIVERVLLDSFAPAAIVINDRSEVIYIHGSAGKFLEPSPGEASLNILRMAREGLRLELAAAIRKVASKHERVAYDGLNVKTNGATQLVNLAVQPLDSEAEQGLVLVTFEAVAPPKEPEHPLDGEAELDRDEIIRDLERELRAKEEVLQTAIEELETSNEELKSTNEELQSSNEELQSTNEELETSKEELQSVNEELVTVNGELERKIDELGQINDDMANLMAATDIGTVFLDQELNIVRFTPAATRVINLIPTDLGRPVAHIASNLRYDGLMADIKNVLKTGASKEIEVQSNAGDWYLVRILPYIDAAGARVGVVLTFVDFSEQRKALTELRYNRTVLNRALRLAELGTFRWDLETGQITWSDETYRILGIKPHDGQLTEMELFNSVHPDDKAAMSASRIAQWKADDKFEAEVRIVQPAGGAIRCIHLWGETERDRDHRPIALIGLVQDVTEQQAKNKS